MWCPNLFYWTAPLGLKSVRGAQTLSPIEYVEKTMPSITHCRVAAVAVVSTLALIALSADAFAKSRHPRPRAAPAASVLQGTGATTYPQYGGGTNIYSRPVSRGNVIDNTAGWGDVGAR